MIKKLIKKGKVLQLKRKRRKREEDSREYRTMQCNAMEEKGKFAFLQQL